MKGGATIGARFALARRRRGINRMVTWYVVVFSLGAIVITGGILTAFSLRSYRAAISGSLELAARYAANGAERFLSGQIDFLEAATWLYGNSLQDDAPDQGLLEGILGYSPAILQVGAADRRSGSMLRLVSRRSETAALAAGLPFGREAALEAEAGKPYLSPAHIDPVTGEFLITIGVAPFERFGKANVTLIAELNLKFMWDIVADIGIEKGGRSYVVDSGGALVAYGDSARVLIHENLTRIPAVAAFEAGGKGRPAGNIMSFIGIEGDRVVGTYIPLEDQPWAVVVELPWAIAYRDAINANALGILAILAMSAAIYFTGVMLAKRISSPIVSLAGAVSGMAERGQLISVEASGPREVADLAEAFNAMAERLSRDAAERQEGEREKEKLQERLQQAMKMEAVGRLAGGIAHDFNNLLTGIYGSVQLARMEMEDGGKVECYLSEIQKEAESAASLTRQLLAYSRKQPIRPKLVDLNALIADVGGMLERLIGEEVEMEFHLGQGLGPVRVDPSQFQQVLVNLSVNARDAMPGGGRLSIRTEAAALDVKECSAHDGLKPGRHLRLIVEDSGSGIDAEAMKHLFEPFYTTKPLGKGTGLGLAMVYGAVRQSGGAIEVKSDPERGTAFSILLPMEEGDAESPDRSAAEGELKRGDETILLVDDRPAVMEVTARILERLGYSVIRAGGGEEALARLRDGASIDAVVTDVSMPGMDGIEFAERAKALRPGLHILFVSGYAEDAHMRERAMDSLGRFVMKPFTIQELAAKVRLTLDGG